MEEDVGSDEEYVDSDFADFADDEDTNAGGPSFKVIASFNFGKR